MRYQAAPLPDRPRVLLSRSQPVNDEYPDLYTSRRDGQRNRIGEDFSAVEIHQEHHVAIGDWGNATSRERGERDLIGALERRSGAALSRIDSSDFQCKRASDDVDARASFGVRQGPGCGAADATAVAVIGAGTVHSRGQRGLCGGREMQRKPELRPQHPRIGGGAGCERLNTARDAQRVDAERTRVDDEGDAVTCSERHVHRHGGVIDDRVIAGVLGEDFGYGLGAEHAATARAQSGRAANYRQPILIHHPHAIIQVRAAREGTSRGSVEPGE